MTKLDSIREDFENSVNRLEDVLNQKKNEFIRDSAIQRFEVAFEMAWKLLKAFLDEKKGIICRSPKDCLKEAYKLKIIEFSEFWLKMADLRNETAHTYKEAVAEKVYSQLPEALKYLKILLVKIKEEPSQ